MNRRELLVMMFGLPLTLTQARIGKYGLMTNARHEALRRRGINLIVMVDGVDQTKNCVRADDIEGWADIFKVNVEGKHYIDFDKNPPKVANEIVKGKIEFVALQCQKY